MKFFAVVAFFLSQVFVSFPAQAGDGTYRNPLVFGVIPARSPEQIMTTFGPVIKAMGEDLEISVQIRGAPDFETFIRRVLNGGPYDVIIAGGDTIQLIRDRNIYIPVAQMAGPGISALIMTTANNEITSLDDLRGVRVASADLLSYSTGLAFRTLTDAGINPQNDLDITFVPSQSAALQALLRGQVDASIVMAPVVRSASDAERQSLRILAETEQAPPPAIAVSKSLDMELTHRISEFFLTFEERGDGPELLQRLGWPGFARVDIEAYDELYWAAESITQRLDQLSRN